MGFENSYKISCSIFTIDWRVRYPKCMTAAPKDESEYEDRSGGESPGQIDTGKRRSGS